MLKHTYPPDYSPGTHWAIDEAWAILDTLAPGALTDDVRAFLGGQIAGTLLRVVTHGLARLPVRLRGRAWCTVCERTLDAGAVRCPDHPNGEVMLVLRDEGEQG